MSKFNCFFFGNPINNTETETAYTWGTTHSKPSGPVIMIDQLEILSLSQVEFITLVFGGAQLCCALLPATTSCTNLVWKNNFLS